MPVAITNLGAGGGSGGLTSYSTASVTPTGAVLLSVNAYQSAGSVNPPAPTISGCGLTWTQVGTTVDYDTAGTDRSTMTAWVGTGTPTAGAITISFGATAVNRASWVIDDVTGASSTPIVTTNVQTAIGASATTLSATFPNAFGSASNAAWACFGTQSASGTTFTAGSGWTAVGLSNTQSIAFGATEKQTPATTTTIAGSWSAAARCGLIGAEIAAASGSTTHDLAATGTGTSTGSAELLLAPGALSASGSGATAGSADLDVTLALSATGVGQTGGSADLTIVGGSTTHPLAASGSGSSTGSLAANLKLSLSSTGSGVSGGSLALGSVLTLGSTGTGQTSGTLAITVVEPTYFFSPPTHEEPIRVGVDMPSRPLGYFRMTYAASVVKVGGVWTTIRTPSAELLGGLVDGVDFFRGGYEYQIDRDTAADLEAAGLMSVPGFGYGMGAYGAGPYGD